MTRVNSGSRRATVVLSLLCIALLTLTACAPAVVPPTSRGDQNPPSTAGALDLQGQAFGSEDEVVAFLRQSSTGSDFDGYAYGITAMRSSAAPVPAMAEAADSAGGASGAGSKGSATPGFSTTNNQVVGVDEGDIIKTDGTYIYTVSGTTLFIVRAYPGSDAAVVSTTDLPGQPSGLFVDGDHVLVYGSFYDTDYFAEHDLRPRSGMSYLQIYDVGDRAKPTLASDDKVEGSVVDARLTDGVAYLVVTSSPDVRHPLPIIMRGGTVASVAATDIVRFPMPYSSVQYTTVYTLPLSGGELRSKTVATESTSTIMMSPSNLYLTSTTYVNEWELRQAILEELLADRLEARDNALIAKIRATDDDVLSPDEKKGRIAAVYQEAFNYLPSKQQQALNDQIDDKLQKQLDTYEAMEYTTIVRLAVARGSVAVEATGKLPGTINNQFSLDEHDGVLRVATTISPRWNWWIRPLAEPMAVDTVAAGEGSAPAEAKMAVEPQSQQSDNRVYTLGMDLNVLDSVKNIAPGEQIYSTRFMGDRLYVVTFKQVDPFFVFDLSNPKDIKQLGALKIPGFSRYLHPYDDHTIIGIGRDATARGAQQGLKISLFDVTDPAKPKETASWIADEDYSQSTAEYEHKAFLFDREKELLVIPAYSYDWSKGSGVQQYNGAMVFHITRDAIDLRGIIDHGSSTQYWGPLVERSLWINDLLYTKSPQLLRINRIDDLSSVQKIALVGKDASPYPIY